MTDTATPARRTDNRRRLELRLSPHEFRLLEAAAQANLRSPAAQARVLITRGLRHWQHRAAEED
jgi:hypothetical protein